MIVQPTPTDPRVPARRARALAGLVAPVALLGVVAIGRPPRARALEPIPPAPPRTAVPNEGDAAASQPVPLPALQVPAMFGDLAALDPADVHAVGEAASPATAMALFGFLRMDAADSACGDAAGGPFGTWCDRRGIIAQSSWVGTGTGPFPPHLSIHVPGRRPAAVGRRARHARGPAGADAGPRRRPAGGPARGLPGLWPRGLRGRVRRGPRRVGRRRAPGPHAAGRRPPRDGAPSQPVR